MAPPGTKVVIHEKVDNRKSCTDHGTETWYTGPSIQHYRRFKYYMPVIGRECDADTVEFLPTTTTFPKVTTGDYLRQVVTDLLTILQ